jgi:NADP-dependent 3-hydroxy acid dehydrogenase YdfG
VAYSVSIIEGDIQKWRSMLEINILALLVGCQAGVKTMNIPH